jgi:hypothetical protein
MIRRYRQAVAERARLSEGNYREDEGWAMWLTIY